MIAHAILPAEPIESTATWMSSAPSPDADLVIGTLIACIATTADIKVGPVEREAAERATPETMEALTEALETVLRCGNRAAITEVMPAVALVSRKAQVALKAIQSARPRAERLTAEDWEALLKSERKQARAEKRQPKDEAKQHWPEWTELLGMIREKLTKAGARASLTSGLRDVTSGGISALKMGDLVVDVLNEIRSSGASTFPLQHVEQALQTVLLEQRREHEGKMRCRLLRPLASGERELGQGQLRRFMVALLGLVDGPQEEGKPTWADCDIGVAVLGQYLHDVLRKIARDPLFPAERACVPVLRGRQFSGKSTAAKKLLAPLEDWVAYDIRASALTDDRNRSVLMNAFAGLWDELGGLSKADAAEVKAVITSDVVQYRRLGTNTHETGLNQMRIIATSNDPISTIFRDTTGSTRFFEIVTGDRINTAEMDVLDFPLMWRSVDWRQPGPVDKAMRQAILAVQDTQRHHDPVEAWIEGEHWGFLSGPQNQLLGMYPLDLRTGVSLDDLLRRFLRVSNVQMASNVFGDRLKALGWTSKRVIVERRKMTHWYPPLSLELSPPVQLVACAPPAPIAQSTTGAA